MVAARMAAMLLAVRRWWRSPVSGNYPDVAVRLPSIPPLWRESRAGIEAAALLRSSVWRGAGVEHGDGRPVLLIPGFLAGDTSLSTLTYWLRANGYRTRRAGVVTLGAPTVSQLDVHPLVLAHVAVVGALGTGRMPGMFRLSCLRGECCAGFRHDIKAAVDVPYVALYSRTDGIVNWRSCLDPSAELVEVRASHLGMGLNAEVYAELANALGGFARGEAAELRRAA
jgi:hypothetical protein